MSSIATYHGAAASFWRVMAIARRHGYVLQRSPHRSFDIIVWPVIDVVLFGSIGVFAAGKAGTAGQVALYLLVGVVLWHVVYQAQISLATGFLEETWSRTVLSLMVTPMRDDLSGGARGRDERRLPAASLGAWVREAAN